VSEHVAPNLSITDAQASVAQEHRVAATGTLFLSWVSARSVVSAIERVITSSLTTATMISRSLPDGDRAVASPAKQKNRTIIRSHGVMSHTFY
jgi:hypothetical protein